MKKQIKTLKLKRQTISSLESNMLNGGAPVTFKKTCQSQNGATCNPVPQDPRPATAISKCKPCSSICG